MNKEQNQSRARNRSNPPPSRRKGRSSSPDAACDVLICGAGAPGLTLALLLSKTGLNLSIVIIDPAPERVLLNAEADTRTVALMRGSAEILKAAGAWDACAAQGGRLETLQIIDDSRPGHDTIAVPFRADEIGQELFGINMPNNPLRAALTGKALQTKNIRLITEMELLSYEPDDFGITAQTSGGAICAKLIVGADGRNSAVRQCAGIDAWERDYGQNAITCFIEHAKPHNGTSTEFHRPGGPFALVPLPGNSSSVVWTEKRDDAARLMKLRKNEFERALQECTNDLLGAIKLIKGPQSFPLIALKARRLTAPRMALAAEAAHVLHPLGAQGLNLSLRDVEALAAIIADAAELGLDYGSRAILNRYESRRRADVGSRLAVIDTLNRMVSNDAGALKTLRRAGLKAVGSVPFLKDFVMQQGMAPDIRSGIKMQ
ncbi:MAG: FAD-dependent monooxygenase [Proteobacteria bacterium]|nr:FAD-dependent monooxygenase [Pseudomonadota bacterium]